MNQIGLGLPLALLVVLGSSVAAAPDGGRAEIEAAYGRAAYAAELKYVEGLLANRTDDYELYTDTGSLVDLTNERARFRNMLEPATRVQLETKIKRFETRPHQAMCYVEQFLRVETAAQTGLLETSVIHTLSKDFWVETADGWRVSRSQVFRQAMGKGENLPPAYLKPTKFEVKYKTPKPK